MAKKLTAKMIRVAVEKMRSLSIPDFKGWIVMFGPCPRCGFKKEWAPPKPQGDTVTFKLGSKRRPHGGKVQS